MDDLTKTTAWRLLRRELQIEGMNTDTEAPDTIVRFAAGHIRRMRGEIEDLMHKTDSAPAVRVEGE